MSKIFIIGQIKTIGQKGLCINRLPKYCILSKLFVRILLQKHYRMNAYNKAIASGLLGEEVYRGKRPSVLAIFN